ARLRLEPPTRGEVLGIVGEVKHAELSRAAAPTVYGYARQRAWDSMSLVVRTAVAPATLAQPAVAALRALDPEQPIENVRTMEEGPDNPMTSERVNAPVPGVFAAVPLTLT